MNIYLVRHAIAESHASSDSERSLTEDGFAQAAMVAEAIKKLNIKLDMVATSPYLRACQTAEAFTKVFGCDLEKLGELAPGVNMDSLFKKLQVYETLNEIMLVGHEPDMGEITSTLVHGERMFRMPYKKSQVCCVRDCEVPPVMPGVLSWLITPQIIQSLSI